MKDDDYELLKGGTKLNAMIAGHFGKTVSFVSDDGSVYLNPDAASEWDEWVDTVPCPDYAHNTNLVIALLFGLSFSAYSYKDVNDDEVWSVQISDELGITRADYVESTFNLAAGY